MAELTIFATAASAQNYANRPGVSSLFQLRPRMPDHDTYNTPVLDVRHPTPPIGTSNPSQAAPNASLLAVPVVGTAPLTVDFYVGLANTPGSLLDEWNFGDGAELFLPAQPYMLHVYQHPGTYMCELELVTAQGITTTVFTKITVKSRQG